MSILTTADKFKFEIERILIEEVERLKETIALGFLDNYDQYRHMTGRVAGLRAAIDFIAEAESRCNSQ